MQLRKGTKMLVLTRRTGQIIDVTAPDGTKITITVTHLDRHKCRLSFNAPHTVDIDRREVTLSKLRTQEIAAEQAQQAQQTTTTTAAISSI